MKIRVNDEMMMAMQAKNSVTSRCVWVGVIDCFITVAFLMLLILLFAGLSPRGKGEAAVSPRCQSDHRVLEGKILAETSSRRF